MTGVTLPPRNYAFSNWMSSDFERGKAALHRIQGLGGVWLAGNNTTFDAEEGAVLSAIGVGEKLLDGFESPLSGLAALRRPHAIPLHRHFVRGITFPETWSLRS